jgi:hypothetical protein
MAASTHYDGHAIDAAAVMLDAMRRHPIPPEMLESGWWKPSPRAVSAEDGAKYVAIFMSYLSLESAVAFARTCHAATTTPRREACIAIGRLLVRKGLDVPSVRIGEGILRNQKSLEAADAERSRRVHWWQDVMERQERSESVGAYLDDYLATGNQVEALERNAARLGKTEPPVNWKPRRWINAE